MTRTTPPRTSSLHHAQDRDHVILDLDGIASDADAHRFYVRHGDALRAMLIDPLDVDTYEPALDDYRADIGALEKATQKVTSELDYVRIQLDDIAVMLELLRDRLDDHDAESSLSKLTKRVETLSERIDSATDDLNAVEIKTSW